MARTRVGWIGAIAASVALAIMLGLGLHAVRGFFDASKLVERTATIQATIGQVRDILLDAETAQRGYVLTGRTDYLGPYISARARLDEAIPRLRALLSDNPEQLVRLASVEGSVERKMNELAEVIAARRDRGLDAARSVVEANRGKRRMDTLRRNLAAMHTAEDGLLASREDVQAHDAMLALAALVVTSGLFGLLLVLAWAVRRSARAHERVRAAEAARLLAENERLAEKTRATQLQEQFVAILGHDLRSPLQALSLGLTIVEQAGPEARVAMIARLRGSTRRMKTMVEQLLDLARARVAGGLAVAPARADLQHVVRDVVDELRAANPDATVHVETDGDLFGDWDCDRLEQLASNLIGNAIDHGDPTIPVRVRLHGDLERVTFEVHNFGAPIPEKTRSELFEPYHQRETSRVHRRAGLGLYIANEIVTAHRGTIDVTSSEAEGTRFAVTLPRRAVHGT
jgi:signal transduction histidine kinase